MIKRRKLETEIFNFGAGFFFGSFLGQMAGKFCDCDGCFPLLGMPRGKCRTTLREEETVDGIVEIRDFEEKLKLIRKIQFHMTTGLPPTPEMYEEFKVMAPEELEIIMSVGGYFGL